MTTLDQDHLGKSSGSYSMHEILKLRIVRFFNRVIRPEDIVGRIYDDPNFGRVSNDARGITMSAAAKIIQQRAKLKDKKFTSIVQIKEVPGIGLDTMHDILYSFLSGRRNKTTFNTRITERVLEFFNQATQTSVLIERIKDDPCIGNNKGQNLTLKLAAEIIAFRDSLPEKKFKNIRQIRQTDGLGGDTLHDILYSFWETDKSSDDIDLSLEADDKWEGKLFDLYKKIDDTDFKVNLLSNRAEIFNEFELPENRMIETVLPPILTAEKAEQLVSVASEKNQIKIEKISDKAIQALANRDNVRIKKVVERLQRNGLKNSDGTFTNSAKESISSIIQNPQEFLDDLGVELSETEKKSLWSGFSQKEADALSEWKSNTQSDVKPIEDESFLAALKTVESKVTDDRTLQFEWLTKPEATFLEHYPDTDKWQLNKLPDAMSEQSARALIDEADKEPAPKINNSTHNSSDLKIGFSINTVHDIFKYLINFPLIEQYPDNTQSPFAQLEIIELPYPEIIKPDLNLLRSTGKARFTSYVFGIKYEATLEIRLAYSIFAVKDRLFFSYDAENTTVIVTDGSQEAFGTKPKEALDGIFGLMGNSFEYRLNLPEMSLPIGEQVEVIFDAIKVHDDKDTIGSGELYFELGVNSEKYLFGQYDANSGDTISLNKRFLLSKDKVDSLNISVRGKDRDVFASTSDYMGDDFKIHRKEINMYGSFSLAGYTHEIQYEMVMVVIETLFKVVCWFVDVIVKVLDACAKLVGIRTEKRKTCQTQANTIFGWVREATEVRVRNYTLMYRVNALPVPEISTLTDLFEFDNIEMTNNSVYVSLNLKEFAGLSNNSTRTDFKGELKDEIALIVSENLLSKAAQAINLHGPVSRYFTTNFDDITAYYSVETKNSVQINIDNGSVYLRLPITGSAGLNVIGLNPTLNAPNAILIKSHIFAEGLNPFNKLDQGDIALSVDAVWLEGGNLSTVLANILLAFAQIFFIWPKMFGRNELLLLSFKSVTSKLNEYYQLQFSEQETVTSNDEIILKSKVSVELLDGATPPPEKIFNQQLITVPLDIEYGVNGTVASDLVMATSMAFDSNGYTYVNDVANGKVVKYDLLGTEVSSWGGWGIGDGQFTYPFDVEYDAFKNRLLVTDTMNRRVQIFDTDGNYLDQWGGWNDLDYNFSVPQAIAVNPVNGDIFVIDAAKNFRVQHFDSALNFIREWGGNGNQEDMFVGINSMAINSLGEIFISDFSSKKIKKYTTKGVYVSDWSINAEANNQFLVTLTHLTVAADDALFAYAPGLLPQIKSYSNTGQFLFNLEPKKTPNPGTNWNTIRAFLIDNERNAVFVLEDKVFKFNNT